MRSGQSLITGAMVLGVLVLLYERPFRRYRSWRSARRPGQAGMA